MKLAIAWNLGLAVVCSVASGCSAQAPPQGEEVQGEAAAASVGASCSAGATRCVAGTSVQTCSAAGTWTKAAFCATGSCAGSSCSGSTISGTSCAPGGAGLTNCDGDVCCSSLAVPRTTYSRTYTNAGSGPIGEADPATVSGLLLDRYPVTVGRFRQFVKAWKGGAGWVPAAGSGKHAHLSGGKGLVSAGNAGSYETGWIAGDDVNLAPTDANLACGAPDDTWTSAAAGNENLPINCVNWWEAAAFCIWDGGFLPSEAEWELAAAGGAGQREYPWGKVAPGTASQYAIFGDYYPTGVKKNRGLANVAPVGSAPLGRGLWGQADLAGEMLEWTLDWFAPYADPCVDCADVTAATDRVVRGSAFSSTAAQLPPWLRSSAPPVQRSATTGVRCARDPFAGKTTRLSGSVQKGPFIVGSTVLLTAIDGTGIETGQTFTAHTTDDLGSFGVAFDYAGNLDIQAEGFYYNEVTGTLSTAPIALRALYVASGAGAQPAHINMVTHLAHDRALALMQSGGGYTLATAESQAEGEVVAALGVGGGFDPGIVGIDLDIVGGNTVQNAYLFAVSAIFGQAAVETAGQSSVDAQLQEILGQIAADLVDDGAISAAWTPILRKAEQDLDVDLTMDLFHARLLAIGSTSTAASLNLATDSDGDGYRNAIDTCSLVSNPTQSVVPSGVLCQLTRHSMFVPGQTLTDPPEGGVPPPYPLVGKFTSSGLPGELAYLRTAAGGGWMSFPGEGTGRVKSAVATQLPAGFIPWRLTDQDGDGHLDAFGFESGGIWGWAPGDGTGVFGAFTPSFSPSNAGMGAELFNAGDFNGDGLLDLAGMGSTPAGTSGVVVALGTGSGMYAAPVATALPCAQSSCSGYVAYLWTTAADVNADGKLDLVVSGYAPTNGDLLSVVTMLGDGTGSFAATTPVSFPVTSNYGSGVWGTGGALVADFDGDGHLDVGAWWLPAGKLAVGFGDGTGSFGPASSAVITALTDPIVAGDFNGDGKADLVAAFTSPCANFRLTLSQGRTFAAGQVLRTYAAACSYTGYGETVNTLPTPLASIDMNGDGVLDVVYSVPDATGSATLQTLLMNYLQ